MRFYRLSYYVKTESGNIYPQTQDFKFFWRLRLERWLLKHHKDVLPRMSVSLFYDKK